MKRKFEESCSHEQSFLAALNNPHDTGIFDLLRSYDYSIPYSNMLRDEPPNELLLNYLTHENILGAMFNILVPPDGQFDSFQKPNHPHHFFLFSKNN